MNVKNYFIVICFVVALLVLLLSYIELKKAKNYAFAVIPFKDLDDKPFVILSPQDFNLIRYPVYVYKSDNNNIGYESSYEKYKYRKDVVKEHVSQVLLTPLKSVTGNISNVFKSKTPVNNLYGAATEAMNLVNICSLMSCNESIYTIEHHVEDNISAFVSENLLYIIH